MPLGSATTLHRFFHPRSIAVVGASPHPEHIGGRPVRLLQAKGFPGPIYPINARSREIHGLPCFDSLDALPESPDVALVLVKASGVPEALEACVRRSVGFAVVHASGFAETDQEGARLEERVREIVAGSDLRVIGPNCYGSLNVLDEIPLGFALPFEMETYPKGGVGLFSHSGAFGYGFMTIAMEAGVGFSYVLNSGNSVDVDVEDMLAFLADDPDTRVVAAYVEGVRDPGAFERAARRCVEAGKPVVVLRGGRGDAARRAVRLHTGGEPQPEAFFRALADRLAIHLVRDADEFLDVLVGLDRAPIGRGLSKDLGAVVVTTSGASGILFADACEDYGLPLPDVGPVLRGRLARVLPPYAAAENPIDITAMVLSRPSLVSAVIGELRGEPAFGCVVLMFSTPGGSLGPALSKEIEAVVGLLDKPAVAVVTGGIETTKELRRQLFGLGVPVFQTPHRAARAVAAMLRPFRGGGAGTAGPGATSLGV